MSGGSPLSAATARRYFGVASAVVVPFPEGAKDDSGEGRVCLRFPWFDPQMATPPVRVAQLYAGNGYGAMWRPEIGDEVVVGFVHGDIRDPIVLGGVYNGKDKPFTAPDERTDRKAFVTKAGHRVVFDDKDGSVTVATKTGASIVLDGDGKSITVTADDTISFKAKNIELTADGGDVTVRGKKIRLN